MTESATPTTATPASTTPTTDSAPDLVDTRDMVTVHRFLRREFRLLPGLVARVPDGDRVRAEVVADHVDFLATFLHHHHTAEDNRVWPLLLERVPDELAPLVHLMEQQHHRVDELLHQIGAVVPAWRESAAAGERDLLVTLATDLHESLVEHMDAEEAHILPLAARALTLAEWEALGEEASSRADRTQMPLLLGMIQYEGDPEVVAAMLAKAPWVLRAIVPRLSRRAFRRYCLRVHGTATP